MKKVFLITLFLTIVTQYGFSQFFVGGGLSYQHTNSKILNNSNDNTLIEISPLLGYRFDKANVGLLFLYQSETSSSTSDEIKDIGFGIFGSYNIFSFDRISIYGRAMVQYINSKYKTQQNINTIGVSITPIFEYKLFEHFSLYSRIGIISFSHSWGELKGSGSSLTVPKVDVSTNSFRISLSTGIALGFNIVF